MRMRKENVWEPDFLGRFRSSRSLNRVMHLAGWSVRSLGLLRVCNIKLLGNLKFSIDTELKPPTGIPESLATVPIS